MEYIRLAIVFSIMNNYVLLVCDLSTFIFISFPGTRFPEVNRRIQRFVNKNKVFPDFHDIRNLVRAANKKYNLGIR